jgi:hypothetical protein
MFTGNDMRTLLSAKPFAPFQLVLSDGRSIPVISPEIVTAGRRYAVIGILDAGQSDTFFDRYVTVYYMHVTAVEMLRAGEPPFSAPPPGGPSESPAGSPA